MSYAASATRYRDVTILTASSEQLVVLLFEHLLVALRRARLAVSTGNIELHGQQMARCSDMVTELLATLDMDRGGEVAVNLRSLYVFHLQQYIEALRSPEVARLDRLIAQVNELHSAFSQAAELVGRKAVAR